MTITTVLLWPMPELDDRPRPPASAPPDSPPQPNGDLPAESAADKAEQDAPSAEELVRQQLTRGYAEGWERGLAEGRERGLAQGREQGYAEGFAAGTEAAQAGPVLQAQRLQSIVARLGGPIPVLDAIVEDAVAALALEVARCVIGRETSRSRDYLVPLIREAIAKVPIEMGAPKLVLNPADLEAIRGLAPDVTADGAALIADETIEPGDCRVVCDGEPAPVKDRRWRPRPATGVSQVDLSLATRWRTAMLAMFEGEEQ